MTNSPVVRISRGRFEPKIYVEIVSLAKRSEAALEPSLKQLKGLLYYHVSVDKKTSTFVNVSLWKDLDSAKQMDSLPAMLAQRPVMEEAGLQFDKIANYEPLWRIATAAVSGL